MSRPNKEINIYRLLEHLQKNIYKCYSYAELAELLDVSKATICRIMKRGDLQDQQLHPDDITTLSDENKKKTPKKRKSNK